MKRYYEKARAFVIKFDNDMKKLLAEKRKQLELENNMVEYVELDDIEENMLATFIQLYPNIDVHACKNEYYYHFQLIVGFVLKFLDKVSGVDWLKKKYQYVTCLHNEKELDLDKDDDNESRNILDAEACFFKSIYMVLQVKKWIQLDEWKVSLNALPSEFEE